MLPVRSRHLVLCFVLFTAVLLMPVAQAENLDRQIVVSNRNPNGFPDPTHVTIAGTIQSQLGCSGDWQPPCEETYLLYDAVDDVWQAAFPLIAGSYEYKVALNDAWDQNYGLNAIEHGPNIPLKIAEDREVKFYYDHKTGWVTDNVNSVIVTAVGTFQDELGCSADSQPDCLRSWLQDPEGDGIYLFATDALPPGDYEFRAALRESDTEIYGQDAALNGDAISFSVSAAGEVIVFAYNTSTHQAGVASGAMPDVGKAAQLPDLSKAKAHWVSRDTIAWKLDDIRPGDSFKLFYSFDANLQASAAGIQNGSSIDLTYDSAGLSSAVLEKFPHLEGYAALKIGEADLELVPGILKVQFAVAAFDESGKAFGGTGLQIPGVLDDLYAYEGPLGVTYEGDVPTLRVWAPTAQSVRLNLFDDANPETEAERLRMTLNPATGVWSITGDPSWTGKYYRYEVRVYAPSTGTVETNRVTDPYSVSLSMNSTRSQIMNLDDPALMPEGWSTLMKPPLDAPEDIVIYELHVRDFSAFDETVPEEFRGKYMAFTVENSNGMKHLRALAGAGLTHLHLLPTFDIATINENPAERQEPDYELLETFPGDSEEQQALVMAVRDEDAFNWGYDPYHYNVPEGSYATDPDGPTRILEYREMVKALSDAGLRTVVDVVYNHTNSSGQAEKSVLDKIVPGYYHRLNNDGVVETSTCCQNTATEYRMMEKLMVDSVVLWAKAYKVDAFRFDLMGHHMLRNMQAVRDALDALTVEEDGIDGRSIYIYGEGWNFGEVANGQRGINATQLNIGGLGIGTFNDRLRDAVRGGSPFGDRQFQGFITGLGIYSNGLTGGGEAAQRARLLLFSDQIRIGLAGNLRDYQLENAGGQIVAGADIDYNGSPAGYTLDPQEQIVYISKHDNETLWDIIQYKDLPDVSVEDLVRIQNLGNSIVLLSQGVPFFQAGDDLLRSKSLDRDSYNSGDWFNRLDFTYSGNNWAVGLPPAEKNQDQWPVMKPLLSREGRTPSPQNILAAAAHFKEMLQIRKSSPLFRLRTAEAIQQRVMFHNTGPEQLPGLIVMSLSDLGADNLDPNYAFIVALFNAADEAVSYTNDEFIGIPLNLHPVLMHSADPIVRSASFDADTGSFVIPARTAAVFVAAE